jgi:hypothetical protein
VIAGEALAQMAKELDDPGLIHHEDMALIALSEAQRLVSWRFKLTRLTAPLTIVDRIPLYRPQVASDRCLWVLYASLAGETLWPVPSHTLRYKDPAWMATQGTPEYLYRYGLTRVGFYPVPDADLTVDLTMLVAPARVVTLGQSLEIPESYLPRVVDVAVGMLLITGERAFQGGMARITRGLDLSPRPRMTERQARDAEG